MTLYARHSHSTDRTIPKPIQWPVKTKTKAPIKLKHDIVHTTSTSFGKHYTLSVNAVAYVTTIYIR